jgi:hypothetical protein
MYKAAAGNGIQFGGVCYFCEYITADVISPYVSIDIYAPILPSEGSPYAWMTLWALSSSKDDGLISVQPPDNTQLV